MDHTKVRTTIAITETVSDESLLTGEYKDFQRKQVDEWIRSEYHEEASVEVSVDVLDKPVGAIAMSEKMDKNVVGVFQMVGLDDGLSIEQSRKLIELAQEHGLNEVIFCDNDRVGLLSASSIACGVVDAAHADDEDLFAATAVLCNDFDALNKDPEDIYYSYRNKQFILIH